MIRRRYLVLAIIFILLNASLESMPKDVVLSIGMNPTATSPRNPGPFGSSGLVKLLEDRGYNVKIVSTLGDIPYAVSKGVDRVILVIIAPEKLDDDTANEIVELVEYRGYSVLLAGENVGDNLNKVVLPLSVDVCGYRLLLLNPTDDLDAYEATGRDAIVARFPGGNITVVPSGYVVPILLNGKDLNAMITIDGPSLLGKVLLSKPGGPSVYAVAFSSSLQAYAPNGGYPVVGVACESGRLRVVILGDSTPFTNMALERSESAASLALDSISYLSGGVDPGRVAIVFINSLYAGNTSVSLKFHPSILLNLIASYYASLESKLPSIIGVSLFNLAILVTAVLASMALMPNARLRGLAVREPGPAFTGTKTFLGETAGERRSRPRSDEALELCAQADLLLKRSVGIGLGEIKSNKRLVLTLPEESLAREVERLIELCDRLTRPSIARRLYDLMGLAAKDVEEIARIVDKLQARLSGII